MTTSKTQSDNMNCLKKLRIYIIRFLSWLWIKIMLWKFRQALRLRTLAWSNINLNVRLSDPSALQEGFDEHRDTIIRIVTKKIASPEWFDEALSKDWQQKPWDNSGDLTLLVSEYASNREEVDQLCDMAESNLNVKNWLIVYLRSQCYIETNFNYPSDKDKIKYWSNRLGKLGDKDEPIVSGDIQRITSQAKQDLKKSRFALSEREAVKISLSLDKAGAIISLLSALLLISGFTYTYWFYSFFGVPVSLYFSVSDYISSSIEQIDTVLLSLFAGSVGMFLGIHEASRTPTTIFEDRRKKPDHLNRVLIVLIAIFVFAGLFIDKRAPHPGISWGILLILFPVLPYLAKIFFKDRTSGFFVLFIVTIFISHMYRTVYSNVYDVLEGQDSIPKICEQVNITLDNDAIGPPCGSPVIGSTETHVFIFNQNQATTVILPRSQEIQGVFDSPLLEKSWTGKIFHWLTSWVLNEETQNQLRGVKNLDNREKLKNGKIIQINPNN